MRTDGTFEGFGDNEAPPASLVTVAPHSVRAVASLTMPADGPAAGPDRRLQDDQVTAVLHTDPRACTGSISAQPGPSGDTLFADVAAAILVVALALLHLRRMLECSHAPPPAPEWMCATDPFASWSFVPVHGLAALAGVAWACQAVRGGLGQAWRCVSRYSSAAPANAASARQLELFLAAWSLCWFSPASPFAATADCADSDEQCGRWAASGECERNSAFMATTCRAACKLCVATLAGGAHAGRGPPSLPRAATLCAGGLLLLLAAARLLLSALGDGTRRHLARLATLLCRPVRWLAALALRSPLGPTLRAAVRVLGACLRSARAMLGAVLRPLSQVSAAVGAALAHAFRRRLIVVLGGTLEEQGSKGL